jgi:2-polyprenyl-6-methoxyphenol hydroxylase-like FAD-dependent oxidoreductase
MKIARIDIETAGVILEDGSTVSGDLVVGADGRVPPITKYSYCVSDSHQ